MEGGRVHCILGVEAHILEKVSHHCYRITYFKSHVKLQLFDCLSVVKFYAVYHLTESRPAVSRASPMPDF